MKARVAILAASVVALAAGSAAANTIFDDGPTDGTVQAFFIDGPIGGGLSDQSIYDTFMATGGGQVGELQFGLWVPTGNTPTTVEWSLGTFGSDNSLGGGTVALNAGNSAFLFTNGIGYDIYEVTLTGLTSSTLSAGGTYVLTLGNGNDSGDTHFDAWDVANGGVGGPATCGFIQSGVDLGSCGLGGEAFTLSTAGVPEPATWALMLAGFAGLGAALRSRRARPATA